MAEQDRHRDLMPGDPAGDIEGLREELAAALRRAARAGDALKEAEAAFYDRECQRCMADSIRHG